MFLTMMVMLAIASTIVELMFAAKISVWRRNAYKLKWVNMVISILLSFILGLAFGAAGIIALGAAMISTVLSIPGYAFLNWNYDTEKAKVQDGNRYQYAKKTVKPKLEKGKELGSDLIKVGYVTGKVITSPVWISRKVYRRFKSK